jgi:putative ABC transport system permease protein
LARAALGTVSGTVEALYQAAPAAAVVVTPALAAEGFLLGCVVAALAGLVPITEALRTVPREVLHVGWIERRTQIRTSWVAGVGVGFFLLALLAARAQPIAGVPFFGYAAALCIILGGACLIPLIGTWLGRLVDPRLLRLGWIQARVAAGILAATPGRTAVAAGALMTALAMMVSVIVMVGSFRRTVEHWIAETMSADLFVTPASRAAVGPGARFRDERIIGRIAAVPGVAAVDPYRAIPVEYQGHSILVSARDLGIVAQRSTMLFQTGDAREILYTLAQGRGVAVSEVLARFHGLAVGDTISLPIPTGTASLLIIAIFHDYATDGGRVLLDRHLFRRHWNDDGVTAAAVYLDPGVDAEAIRTALFQSLAPVHRIAVTTNRELKREVLDIFDRTFAITRALDLVALGVAMLGVANTVLAIVLERRRELGILRALGVTRAGLRRIVVWEASLIGVVGAMLGVVAGYAVSIVLIRVINLQSFGWTIRFQWGGEEVFGAAALAVAAALVAGWLPAQHAARSPIVEVLTDE